MLYPLAGSILVDCRRITGDGLLYHETYTAMYKELHAMGAVNEAHPYLRMVLPTSVQQQQQQQAAAAAAANKENEDVTMAEQ